MSQRIILSRVDLQDTSEISTEVIVGKQYPVHLLWTASFAERGINQQYYVCECDVQLRIATIPISVHEYSLCIKKDWNSLM